MVFFDDIDAVRRFAADDYETAVVAEDARRSWSASTIARSTTTSPPRHDRRVTQNLPTCTPPAGGSAANRPGHLSAPSHRAVAGRARRGDRWCASGRGHRARLAAEAPEVTWDPMRWSC